MDFLNFELELKLNTGTGTRTQGLGTSDLYGLPLTTSPSWGTVLLM